MNPAAPHPVLPMPTRLRPLLLVALASLSPAVLAQTLSLSPAVVPLRGQLGESTTQTLTLTNGTSLDLGFELLARDVVVRDGKRVLLEAGSMRGSIAATAVFSQRTLQVPAGEKGSVSVTLTLPPAAAHRAVVVFFRGTTLIPGGRSGTTASLGTLLTFTLSERFALAPVALTVTPQSETANAAFEQVLLNEGDEPLVPAGALVVVDGAGAIVGRSRFDSRRLLPGEQVAFRSEYPGELRRGRYRVLATFEFEGRSLTRSAELNVQ